MSIGGQPLPVNPVPRSGYRRSGRFTQRAIDTRVIGWLPSLVETHSPDTLSNPTRLSVVMGSYPNRPAGAMNKTLVPPQDSSARQWYLVDAENQTLGRLATEVASVLRGKNNPNFAPHIDAGDFVVVINAEKVRVSGNKASDKVYRRHSGRPGGMKTETFAALQARIPERIIEKAVKGMLPHNALGRQLFRKLKVYKGAEHPHAAQQPKALALDPAASAK